MKPEITNRPCPWNGAVANLLDAEQRFSETAARLDAALKTLSAEVKRLERRGAGEDVGA